MNTISYRWFITSFWKELLPSFKYILILGAFVFGIIHLSDLFISPFLILLLRYISFVAFHKNGTSLLQLWKEHSISKQSLLWGLYGYTFSLFMIADLFYFLGAVVSQFLLKIPVFTPYYMPPMGILVASIYFWSIAIYLIPSFIRQLHSKTPNQVLLTSKEVVLLALLLGVGILLFFLNVLFPSDLCSYGTTLLLILLWFSSIWYSQTHTVWEK